MTLAQDPSAAAPPQRVNQLLATLSRVNQIILRIRDDRAQLLHNASRIICDQLGYDLVWLGEINRHGEVIRGASQSAPDGSRLQSPPISESIMSCLRDTAIGAARECERVVHKPIDTSTTGVSLTEDRHLPWCVSAFPVPVNRNNTFVLVACTHADAQVESTEVRILQELAGDLGFAIETMEVESRTHQAESALRMSEERFRRLAESSMAGIVLIQNDLYRYVNPAFAEIFGYNNPDEIIDTLGPMDLAAPESRQIVHDNVQRRILGQVRSVHYQYHGLRKDGTVIEVEEYGARTIHARRLGVIATVLDVTAREASRRRLQALSEAGLALSGAQTVQDALTNAIQQVPRLVPCDTADIVIFQGSNLGVEHHAHAGKRDGIIQTIIRQGVSLDRIPGFRKILEAQQSAVVTEIDVDDILHLPAEEPLGACAGAPLTVRGEIIGFLTAEVRSPSRFSDEDARHLRLFADHVAATLQHLRLISSLEEERNRLRTLNRVSHTLSETLQLQEVSARALQQIGHSLQADISILYLWDRTAERLSAIAAEGISTERLADFNAKLAAQGSKIAQFIEAWDAGGGVNKVNSLGGWHAIRRIGEDIYPEPDRDVRSVLDIPLEAHGELIGFLSFMSRHEAGSSATAISAGLSATESPAGFTTADADLVKALGVPVALAIQNARFYERAARQAEAMAEALHRQEELDLMKDELIQNISHELRTPLALVMGYAEMLNSGQLGPIEGEQANAIGVITRRSRMLRSLVEDIALLWHLERRVEAKEPLDLCIIVETTIDEFQSQADERSLKLKGTTPDCPVLIEGVAVQIRRVLDNLIGNSLKFTPEGGSVVVNLSVRDNYAELAVTDTGIGVPQEKLQQIFERFYQVDGSPRRRYSGTGLGLALVKAIAEAHNGTVRATSPVTSDPEHPGTTIAVRFPVNRTG